MKVKLKVLLLKIVGIGLLVILLGLLANSIILKSSIPERFIDAKWEGTWKSSSFSIVGGKIIANLPDEIPNNREFKVDAMIYYNIWSFYKIGRIKEFQLIGMLGSNNSGGGENIIKANRELKLNSSISFKAELRGSGNQKIEYLGISNNKKSIIVGGYKSLRPNDLGNFKIEKKL